MTVRVPRYTAEEAARRGDEIYNRSVKASVEPDHAGEYVAIDIETGAWEMDTDQMTAGDKMFARNPDAQIWMMRVGSPYLHRIGGGRRIR